MNERPPQWRMTPEAEAAFNAQVAEAKAAPPRTPTNAEAVENIRRGLYGPGPSNNFPR